MIVTEKVLTIISKKFGLNVDDIKLDATISDLGGDSLDVVELNIIFEESTLRTIPLEKLNNSTKVSDIISLLSEKVTD